jgi:hypothetical protein
MKIAISNNLLRILILRISIVPLTTQEGWEDLIIQLATPFREAE